MQKARIRTAWKNKDRTISIKELANALSAICWRLSLNAAKNLHEQDFHFSSDEQRLHVIREYLFFLIHCSDRLIHERFELPDRYTFISCLSQYCLRHYVENARELLARETDFQKTTESLNQTMRKLSECRFSEHRPGHEMLKFLGLSIQGILGHDQVNKWVLDQVIQIDGPNLFELFSQSFVKLTRSSRY